MNLENQVCSLELSKKLLTLGVKQNSMFSYLFMDDQEAPFLSCLHNKILKNNESQMAAFTSSELFEILPSIIDTKNNEPFNNFRFNMQRSIIFDNSMIEKKIFIINYHCDTIQFDSGSPFFAHHLIKHNIWDENLSNALAKTLIYLIENGYFKNE